MKKKILTVATITSLIISVLCGCSKTVEPEITTAVPDEPSVVAESSAVAEPTNEIEVLETAAPEPTTPAKETVEISSADYLADYPMVFADNTNVFFKVPDGYDFYPDDQIYDFLSYDFTFGQYYSESNTMIIMMSPEKISDKINYDKIFIVYCGSDDPTCRDIDWYEDNKELGHLGDGTFKFDISEPVKYDNGITMYTINSYSTEYDYTKLDTKLYTYDINDTDTIAISLNLPNDTDYEADLIAIDEFYKNTSIEELFTVVNTDEYDIVIK